MGKKFKLLRGLDRYKQSCIDTLELLKTKEDILTLDPDHPLAYISGSSNSGVTNTLNVLINDMVQKLNPNDYMLYLLDCTELLTNAYIDFKSISTLRVKGNLQVEEFQNTIEEIIAEDIGNRNKIVVIHDLDVLLDRNNTTVNESLLQKILNLVNGGIYCIVGMNDYYSEYLANVAKYVIALRSNLRLSNQLIKCPKAVNIRSGNCLVPVNNEIVHSKLPLIDSKTIKENFNSLV